MARKYDLDLFVIGAGSGGVRASRIAGQYGAKVAVAEERYLGGTCVNVGCIPKKLLVYAAEFGDAFADAAGFGWAPSRPAFDWQKLIANKNHEIERLNGVYERLLTGAGVAVMRGHAEIVDPHTVVIGGRRISVEYLLAASACRDGRRSLAAAISRSNSPGFSMASAPRSA
jgi:glutathione reductase (NADPH)